MLLAIVFYAVGFGVCKLVNKKDNTGIIIYSIIGILILVIGVSIAKSSVAGLGAAAYIGGVVTAYKSLK